MIHHICFIVPNYPYREESVFTFVKQIVDAIADMGIMCSVIASQSLSNRLLRRTKKRPFFWKDKTEKGNTIDVYQPIYISLSNYKLFGRSITSYLSQIVIEKTFNRIKIKPDVLYAHFWDCGVTAGIIRKKHNIPVFVASGESRISVKDKFCEKKIRNCLEDIDGVICVSSKNGQEIIDLKLAPKHKLTIIPNAVNHKLFYHIDKDFARKRLGFNKDAFIVAFTGSFIHRKGIKRVSEAVDKVGNVKTIYIGSGEQQPTDEEILFSGRLPHNQIVNYLNAADVFVLPTLAEGCCNAIIEAMACGLPIISSNLSFNDEILDQNNSIRVNPINVHEIASAIKYLQDNPDIRNKMACSSLEKSKTLRIEERAKKIIKFIKEKCKNNAN